MYDFLKKIIAALAGFTLVILVHEMGHFTFCKLFSIATPTFSIGFGPALIQKKIGATNFVLATIPLGGYVEIKGMEGESTSFSIEEYYHAFFTKPYYQQVLVILGGILFNLIFTFFIGRILKVTKKPQRHASEPLEEDSFSDDSKIEQPFKGAKGKNFLKNYGNFVGPVGIFSLVGQSTKFGFRFYWFLLALISFNLALINLMPLPIFDGGQLLFYSLQALGFHITHATKNLIFILSWITVLCFMALVSIFDIKRLFRGS